MAPNCERFQRSAKVAQICAAAATLWPLDRNRNPNPNSSRIRQKQKLKLEQKQAAAAKTGREIHDSSSTGSQSQPLASDNGRRRPEVSARSTQSGRSDSVCVVVGA